MATRDQIITYIYDLKDKVTGKLRAIVGASKDQGAQADKTAEQVQRSNDKISKSYDGIGGAIGKLRGIFGALGIVIGINQAKDALISVLETGERFDDLGKKFNTAFGGIDAGAAALEKVKEIAAGVPQGFEDVANAAVEMKRRGLDPLDGSLQALLDNANANDHSMEQLSATIEALGKASIKGEVGTRALVSLIELGIPVFELLGKATGKSTEEIRRLAETGQLGANSVKLIVTELGKLRAGAAASEMGDLDSILQKLKDTATGFFNEIAKAGVLDVFKLKLENVKATLIEMERDGTLKKWAQETSDSLTQVGEAVSAIASKWRILSGASDVATGAVQTAFNATLKTLAAGSAFITGAFADITGKGQQTADTFDHLNDVAGNKLAASLKKTAEGARAVGEGLGLANREGDGLGGTFANVKSGAESTASAFRNVVSGVKSTAAEVENLDAKAKAAEASANSLTEAYGKLGIKSQAELQRAAEEAQAALNAVAESFRTGGDANAAQIEDVKRAYEAYSVALRATAKDSSDWAKRGVEGALAVQSALLGLSDVKPPELPAADVQKYAKEISSIRTSTDSAGEGLQDLGDQAGETAGDVGNAAQAIQNIYSGFANELGKTSQAAIDKFTTLTREIFELGSGIADFSGLARFGKAAQDAYDIINGRIAIQKEGVAALADQYANLSDSAIQSLARTRGGVDRVAEGFDLLAQSAREGNTEFDLLGQQDLSALESAASSAAAKVRQIGEEAKAAKEQLQGISDSLQDELDRAAGRNADIENRRFEQQLEQLRQLAEQSGNLNSAEYLDAVRRAKELHDLNLRNIAAEKKARDDAKKDDKNSGSGSSGSSSNNDPDPPKPRGGGGSGNGSATSARTYTINITGAAITQELAREIKKIIDDINRRS